MSAVNWPALSEILKDRYENVLVTNARKFRFWASLMMEADYQLGKENLLATDCSGTVCLPLYAMGYNIRITAQELFDTVFKQRVSYVTMKNVHALFFQKSDGRITHVAPFVGPDVCLNAGDPVSLRTSSYLIQWFEGHEHAEALCRELDWDVAEDMSRTGQHAWDIDPMLKLLRGDL